MKTFKFQRHVSTETAIIFSWLMYKVLEVKFIMSRNMLIVTTKWSKVWRCESVRIQLPMLCTSINWKWQWVLSKQSFLNLLFSFLLLLLWWWWWWWWYFFPLCLLSGTGYGSSETGSLIHLFLSGKRSLYIWHTPLVNLREYNPKPPAGGKRSCLQIQTFCQIYNKKILSWFLARISSVIAWLPLANQHIRSFGFQGF